MERLTVRDSNGQAHATRVGYYDIIDKLASYEDAEGNGTFVKPVDINDIKAILKNSIPIIIFIALMGILTLIFLPYIQGLATEEGRAQNRRVEVLIERSVHVDKSEYQVAR